MDNLWISLDKFDGKASLAIGLSDLELFSQPLQVLHLDRSLIVMHSDLPEVGGQGEPVLLSQNLLRI